MASLKCNYCGYGIHYHDEPDGTEHFAIPFSTWEIFSPTDKPIIRYILDGPEDYFIIWKCRECGCLHTFLAGKAAVTRAYAPCKYDSSVKVINGIKYRVFDDYLFDAVAEDNLTAEEFDASNKYGSCYYAVIGDNYIYLYDDAGFHHLTACFQALTSSCVGSSTD